MTRSGLPLTESGLRQHAAAAARAMEQGRLTDRERGTVFLLTLFELAGVPAERTEELKAALLELHQRPHLWGATEPGTGEALARLQARGGAAGGGLEQRWAGGDGARRWRAARRSSSS